MGGVPRGVFGAHHRFEPPPSKRGLMRLIKQAEKMAIVLQGEQGLPRLRPVVVVVRDGKKTVSIGEFFGDEYRYEPDSQAEVMSVMNMEAQALPWKVTISSRVCALV
eukprot:4511351-Amphidinium_carterae.2